jgi:hypothetical protein
MSGQDRRMADDVENHTLRVLQEMRTEMREGFRRVDERFTGVDQRLDKLESRAQSLEARQLSVEGSLSKVIDAVTEIAKVQERHSRILAELVETGRIAGGCLNALEARLGRIETQAGFVLG